MHLSKLKLIIKSVSDKFVYVRDRNSAILDHWSVMPLVKGKYHGDCDDFAITTLYKYFGFWGFVQNVLVSHEAKIIRCLTHTNEYHFYVLYEGFCWDNWTKEPLPEKEFLEKTKHRPLRMVYSPEMILPLLYGLIMRERKV